MRSQACFLTLLAGVGVPALYSLDQPSDEVVASLPIETIAVPPATEALPAALAPDPEMAVPALRPLAVFGRVTTLAGEPVDGARVLLAFGADGQAPTTVETNLRGEFLIEHPNDSGGASPVMVTAVATKPGFFEARESVALDPERDGEVELVLRPEEREQDLENPKLETLLSALAPRLRTAGLESLKAEEARRGFEEGCQLLTGRGNGQAAAPFVKAAVELEPTCLECRLALGLAYAESGSWLSADRELTQAAKLASGPGKSRELLLVQGFLQAWRGEPKRARDLLRQAVELDSGDPFALLELGRALIAVRDWAEADGVLEKALEAGALREAHLLRTIALLKLGHLEAAESHMSTYMEAREPRDLALPARLIYLDLRDRRILKEYKNSRSLLELSPKELLEFAPELAGLKPARNQQLLPGLLRRIGLEVERLFNAFPNTMSLEDVLHQHEAVKGEFDNISEAKFDYLMLSRTEKWGLGLTEHRASQNAAGSRNGPKGPVRTAGFASSPLFFHPVYQSGSDFRYLGRQTLGGRPTRVLAFAQRLGNAPVLSRFVSTRSSLPLLIQGLAWVDATHHRILRMRTDLLRIPEEHELSQQTTEIQFGEAQFKELGTSLWLPQEVTVTICWKGRIFRNLHRYSAFKLFRVETEEKRKGPAHATRDRKRRTPLAFGLQADQ